MATCPKCGKSGGVLLLTSVAPCDECAKPKDTTVNKGINGRAHEILDNLLKIRSGHYLSHELTHVVEDLACNGSWKGQEVVLEELLRELKPDSLARLALLLDQGLCLWLQKHPSSMPSYADRYCIWDEKRTANPNFLLKEYEDGEMETGSTFDPPPGVYLLND